MKPIPQISQQTFWDIDLQNLNYEESAEWIMLRVFDRGSLKEVRQVCDYYGHERVKNTLTSQTSLLPDHSILLAKGFFNLSFHDFKCLEKRPFRMHSSGF
jgi:hypothetical protein